MATHRKVARSTVGKTGRPMAAIGVAPVRKAVTRGKRTSMVWQWAVVLASGGDTSAPEIHDNKGSARGAVVGLINTLLGNGHDVDARWEDQTGSTQRVVYSVNEEGESVVVLKEDIKGRVDVDGNPLPGPRCIDLPWSAKSGQPGNTSLVRRRRALSSPPEDERAAREAAREAKRKQKREPKVKEPKAKREPRVKEPAAPKAPRTPRTPAEPAASKPPRAPRTPRQPPAVVAAPPPPPPPAPPPKAERAPRTPRAPREEREPRTPRAPRGPKTTEPQNADRAETIRGMQADLLGMLDTMGIGKKGASHTGRPNPYRIGGR